MESVSFLVRVSRRVFMTRPIVVATIVLDDENADEDIDMLILYSSSIR